MAIDSGAVVSGIGTHCWDTFLFSTSLPHRLELPHLPHSPPPCVRQAVAFVFNGCLAVTSLLLFGWWVGVVGVRGGSPRC